MDPAPTLEGVRVLLVEDEPDSRDILRSILETSGAHVSACASGVEALAALAREVPQIIVSDIGMPLMDGYALIRQIRLLPDPRQSQVSAIALTAYARTEDRRQALSAGFQSHLAKPIQPAELTRAISLLVSGS
jgi:CheY-like chemotaxis protein